MTANLDRALVAAAEYRRLATDGRAAEAVQVARTIDELVGQWAEDGITWEWPAAVRAVALGRVTT
jgi:hypothetical protein